MVELFFLRRQIVLLSRETAVITHSFYCAWRSIATRKSVLLGSTTLTVGDGIATQLDSFAALVSAVRLLLLVEEVQLHSLGESRFG
jgi:hypothetical protein